MTPEELARDVVSTWLDGGVPFTYFFEHEGAEDFTAQDYDRAVDVADALISELRGSI